MVTSSEVLLLSRATFRESFLTGLDDVCVPGHFEQYEERK